MPLLPPASPPSAAKQHLNAIKSAALVCDTISPASPSQSAARKALAAKQFKVDHCTPSRQRFAATQALTAEMDAFEARQQQAAGTASARSPHTSAALRGGSGSATESSSVNFPSRTATATPGSGRASPNHLASHMSPTPPRSSARRSGNAVGSAVRALDESAATAGPPGPSPPSPANMSTAVYVSCSPPRGASAVAGNEGLSPSLPSVSMRGKQLVTALERENGRVHLAAVSAQIEDYCMRYASDRVRYERLRAKIASPTRARSDAAAPPAAATPASADKRTAANAAAVDDDSDGESSTDSVQLDAGALGSKAAQNAAWRNARLREHFSPSLDSLNRIVPVGVNASSNAEGSAGSAGGSSSGESCVLMSYLDGLERVVKFCFSTLSSKQDLAQLVAALSSIGGLQEAGSAFGRWPCLRQDTLDRRLEKLLPGAQDRRALFNCFANVLRDGRVVHATLVAALRLAYYAPSPAHVLEFLFTVLFVHQAPLTQADARVLYRIFTAPHSLRFLARGRADIPAEQLLEAALRRSEAEAAAATAAALESAGSFGGPSALELSLSGSLNGTNNLGSSATEGARRASEASSATAALPGSNSAAGLPASPSFRNRKQEQKALVKKQLQEIHAQQRKKLLEGLTTPALDVNSRVAAEELYFLLCYFSTATAGSMQWSWLDLKTLVTPDESSGGVTGGAAGLPDNLSFTSTVSSRGAAGASPGAGGVGAASALSMMVDDAKLALMSNPKEVEKHRLQMLQQAQRHEQAMTAQRRAMADDRYAGSMRLQRTSECVVSAKLMAELKAP